MRKVIDESDEFATALAISLKGYSHEKTVETVIHTCGKAIFDACDEIESLPIGFGRADSGRDEALKMLRRLAAFFSVAEARREQ